MSQEYIPLSVPNLKGNELNYVTEAIESEWVSSAGPFVERFEQEISEYVGSLGAVACQSGTAGLHLALLACGVGAGEEVVVPTLSFIATVNPVKYVGAVPVFMDCDDSLCMDPIKLKRFCAEECDFLDGVLTSKMSGRTLKSVVVTHVFGNMADMEAIMDIADTYGLSVIEDAAEALGTYRDMPDGRRLHAGTFGTVGVYSFNGNKVITSGGGGMVVSGDRTILNKVHHLSTQAKTDDLYYYHDEVGYNYRMGNVQAAIGLAQLEQLEGFISNKKKNYEYYKSAIDRMSGFEMLMFSETCRPNYWFYSLYIDPHSGIKREDLIAGLRAEKIQSRPVWGLIHLQKPYEYCRSYMISKAIEYYAQIINIPCGSGLNEDQISQVITVLDDIHRNSHL